MANQILKISTIKNYIRCPMLYVFKDSMGIDRESSLALQSQEVAHRVLKYVYYQMLDGTTVPFETIMSKTGSLIYKHGEDFGILEQDQNEINHRVINGLTKYYNRESKMKYNILLLDQPFVLHIKGAHVETKIDLVREVEEKGTKYIRMDIFPDELISTNFFKTTHDIYHTSQLYAFMKKYKYVPQQIIVHNVTSPRQFDIAAKISELNRFETIVANAYNQIQNDVIYPAHSVDCQFCSYQNMCGKYKF